MFNEISTIMFDMGGTLSYSTGVGEIEKREKISRIMYLVDAFTSPDKFIQLLTKRLEAYRCWASVNLVELGESSLWTQWLLPDMPVDIVSRNALELNRLWREAAGKRVVFPETKEVILELFRRGYRLGLVSNTTSSVETPHILKDLEISGVFETVILSCVLGIRKPGPGILLEAASRMGILPEDCAYIGNRIDRDLISSRKAGFSRTIIFRHPGNLEQGQQDDPSLLPDCYIENLKDLLGIFPSRKVDKIKNQKFNTSLSTMWAIGQFPSLNDFHEASQRMGFTGIELNHHVTLSLLSGSNLKEIQFSSIHEPCPAEISVETLKERDWLISSENEHCRNKGVEAIKRSIDLAYRLGVNVVVVHCGNIPSDLAIENQMREQFLQGCQDTPGYDAIKTEMINERAALVGPLLEAVKKSLLELLEYASRHQVRLGLENRYHYYDIPTLDEMGMLLDLAGPGLLGYIHDVGHAHAQDRLGFYPHEEWLQRYSNRMIGVHLHDVIGIADHYAPGLGEVDFDKLAAYLPADAFRTCELQVVNTTEQVKAGLKFLAEHGCIKCL